jgi:hypothetical protein
MNWYNIFYWLTVADGVKGAFNTMSNWFTFFTVVTLIVYVICIALRAVGYVDTQPLSDGEKKNVFTWARVFGRAYLFCQIVCILTWLGYVLTPTSKDCVFIVAGGAAATFVTTDSSTKALPSDVMRYLHLKMEKEISELSTTENKSVSETKKELGLPVEKSAKDLLIEKASKMTKDEIIKFLQTDSTLTK